MTIVFTRIRPEKGYVEWCGFLKSPIFLFSSAPEFRAVLQYAGSGFEQPVHLMPSAWSHYKSRIKTAVFWQFCFRIGSETAVDVSWKVKLDGNPIGVTCYFMPDLSFKTNVRSQRVLQNGTECMKNGMTFTVMKNEKAHDPEPERWFWKNRRKLWLVRKLALLNRGKKRRVWLYCDSSGVGRDNGYYQFLHDRKQGDGIQRYCITHDKSFARSEAFDGIPNECVVLFGTKVHKFLYLRCEKVITAYIEQYNYLPFDSETYGYYRDICDPEIIYLQHGILHAHLPHKYSLERLPADRIVVSTSYEVSDLIHTYHFRKENLIPAGMPRYDYVDTEYAANERKILIAPSWRRYLIAQGDQGEWGPRYDKFTSSGFFKELMAFLNNKELADLLEKYDYTIDLKLHPIFTCYRKCFSFRTPRVRMAETNVRAEEYSVFISDWSSFTFDFVYLKRPILYFCPDYEMFKAGMMDYRQTDIPLERGFGPLTARAEEAVAALRGILENRGEPETVYQQRMDHFFLYYDNGQCDRIYRALAEERQEEREDLLFEDLVRQYEEESGMTDEYAVHF